MNKKNTALLMGACLFASTASLASTPTVIYTLTIPHLDVSTVTTNDLSQIMRDQLGAVCGVGEAYGQGNKTDADVNIQCASDETWRQDLSLDLPTTNGNIMKISIRYNTDHTWDATAQSCTLQLSQSNDYSVVVKHSC